MRLKLLLAQQIKEALSTFSEYDEDSERRYLLTIESIKSRRGYEQLLRHFDILNGKSSALLTHISIMIAVSIFGFSSFYDVGNQYDVFAYLLIGEAAGYIFLTLPAIAATFVTNPYSRRRNPELGQLSNFIRIYYKRRTNFYIAYIGCVILTIIFGITIITKLVFSS